MNTKGRRKRNILAFALIPIILACFCSIASAQEKPNLTPSPPPGCSGDSIIVKSPSCSSECSDDSPLYEMGTLYFYWGVTNNGTAPTTTNAGIYIYVDGRLIINNGMAIPPLAVGQTSSCLPTGQGGGAACLSCPSVSGLCPGTHSIKFVVDSLSTIAESNEADNEYTKTITILSNPQPPKVPMVVSITLGGIYYNPWQRGFNIPTNPSATIQFNMSMDTTNSFVRLRDEYDNDIPGTVQWSRTCSDNDTATFIPDHALKPATNYQVHIRAPAGGISLVGSEYAFDFYFFTKPSTADATPPTIQTVYPDKDLTGVSTTTEILIKFSEAMNPSSINNANITLAGPGINVLSDYFVFYDFVEKLVWVSKNTPFAPTSKYTVTVTPNVRDLRGNWLKNQYQWSFTTGAADTTPPTVLQTIPADGANKVSPNLSIHIVFSEQMNPGTLNNNSGNIRIHDDTANNDYFFNPITINKSTVTFFPPMSDQGPLLLPYGHNFTVTIDPNVKDLAGNSLSTTYSFSFTVAGASDDSAPVLLEGIAPESQWGERWSDGSCRLKLELSASDDITNPLTVTASAPPSYNWPLSAEDSSGVYSYKSTSGEGLSPGTHTLTFIIKDGASPQNNEVTFQRDIHIFKSWPILSSPANGASGVSPTPTFQWRYDETDRPFGYRVVVLDGPAPETSRIVWEDFMVDKGTGTYSISIPVDRHLAPNTKYYWAVFCQNQEQSGYAYSDIWSLTTGGTPPPPPRFESSAPTIWGPVLVQNDNRPISDGPSAGLWWSIGGQVLGPSPADIEELKLTGPEGSGFTYIFTEDNIQQSEQLGLYFGTMVTRNLPNGIYTFTVTDSKGRTATADFDFSNPLTPIPRVDSSTMLPADNSYVNTTTPTFSWTSAGTGCYYRLVIFDWNLKASSVYVSGYTQDTQITVPPGYLLPNTPYKWRVDAFDAPAKNRSRSDTLRFSTGGYPYALDIPNVYIWGDNDYYNKSAKSMGANVIGPLPNEVTQVSIAGPAGFIYNFQESNIQLDLGFQGILYGYGGLGSPANGTYTFNVQDKYGATEGFSKDQTSAAIPIVDQSSLSPSNNVYLNTLTPTFKWAGVGGSNRYYRVKINDWMGRYTVYNSPVSTGLSATIPSGILRPNCSYKWRVEVFDNVDRFAADNRSTSAWNTFTIAINISALTPVVTSFKINNGALTTGKAIVTLNNVATNKPTHYMASEDKDFVGAIWQAYSTAPNLTLSANSEMKTVHFKVKNSFAESTAVSSAISALPPIITLFKINNGASATTKQAVTLNNVAANSPTHYMASEEKDFVGAIWQAYSTAPNFALSAGPGDKTVYFKVKNNFAESPAPTANGKILAEAPTLTSFKINNGGLSTTISKVTLNNVTTGSPTHYIASEDSKFLGADWQPYSTAPSFNLSDVKASPEKKTVYFKVKNSFGESNAMDDDISAAGPSPVVTSFKINAGALSTGNVTVTLNNTSTNLPTYYKASELPDFSDMLDWQPYSTTPSFNLSLGTGTKTVYFKTRNIFGESLVKVDTIDAVMPEVTSFKINNGALSTGNGTVTLNNIAKYNPAHYKAAEDPNFNGVNWEPYSTAPTFSLSSSPGPKTVYFKVKNIFGESVAKTYTILALSPVVTSFKINNGASTTPKTTVTLNNVAPGSPTHYKSAEDPNFNGVNWEPYSTAPTFNLSSSPGPKTVYFKVKNIFGESVAKTYTILALSPAVTLFKINNGASSTANGRVTLNNVVTGSPTHYKASEDSKFLGADWQPYSTAPSFNLGDVKAIPEKKTVYFKVKTSFAESNVMNDEILAAGSTPTVTSFKINSGAPSTAKGIVTLNNIATNSPMYYKASEKPDFSDMLDWQPYSTAPSFSLSTGSGMKIVYFKVKNIFGESLPAVSDTISPLLPVVTSFKINNGALSTATGKVALHNVATNSPTHYMASEKPDFSDTGWQPYSTAPSFNLSTGSEMKTVYFKVKNGFGDSAPASSDTILPLLPVVTSFKINNGASSTAAQTVTLNNMATNNPTYYMASEDPDFGGATWQVYGTAPSFTLRPDSDTKTVYIRLKNGFGESSIVSDTIFLY